MGERGLDEDPATGDDIVAMARLVDEAMAAGALEAALARFRKDRGALGV